MQIKFTSGDFSMNSLQELATLGKLTSLHLAGRVDSFDSRQALARLPELKRLRVGLRSAIDSPIMLRGLAQIEEIHIEAYSACTELAIEDTPNLRSLFVKIPTRKVKITNAPYLNSLYVGVCNPKGPNGETTPPLPQFHNKPLTLDVRGFAELESLWIGASEYADELPVSLSGVLLGSLPKLKSFGLRNAEELPTIEGTLPAVTELRIEGKAFLSRVIARNGAFPNLRELISGN